jgi:hypothetical protein
VGAHGSTAAPPAGSDRAHPRRAGAPRHACLGHRLLHLARRLQGQPTTGRRSIPLHESMGAHGLMVVHGAAMVHGSVVN